MHDAKRVVTAIAKGKKRTMIENGDGRIPGRNGTSVHAGNRKAGAQQQTATTTTTTTTTAIQSQLPARACSLTVLCASDDNARHHKLSRRQDVAVAQKEVHT